MKPHLTEDMLIQYQFDLLEANLVKDVKSHLDECSACRGALEQIANKFSALDLLSGEPNITEELISRTVMNAGSHKSNTRRLFTASPQWLSTAAAVLIVGLLAATLYIHTAGRNEKTFSIDTIKKSDSGIDDSEGISERSTALKMLDSPTVSNGSIRSLGSKHAAKRPAEDSIDEKPPFAPASAIELVTLPRRDELQLTIYNSADLTLVREKRNLTMKQGWNWLQFMWANTKIDPTSLSIRPLNQTDKIDVQQLVYPARLKDIGRWLIHSEITGQMPFEITYMTSGISWRAFYMGTLAEDEKTMRLSGHVRVNNNSGEDYEDAQTRLIVGKVNQLDKIADLANRQHPYGSPISVAKGITNWSYGYGSIVDREYDYDDFFTGFSVGDVIVEGIDLQFGSHGIKKIAKEGLSEYFLYTIEGTETIADKWGKRLPSFDIEDIPVESLYKYDEDRYGNQTVRFISFANDEDHEMGDTPIPDGQVKVFRQTNAENNLSYVGGTSVKYIPVDEEVELNLGAARLVKVEPKLMNSRTDNYTFDRKGNINGYDEIQSWQIEVANSRKLPVDIEITRNFNTAYWSLEMPDSKVKYEKLDMTRARFETNLTNESKLIFEYTVTIYHGKREEHYINKTKETQE